MPFYNDPYYDPSFYNPYADPYYRPSDIPTYPEQIQQDPSGGLAGGLGTAAGAYGSYKLFGAGSNALSGGAGSLGGASGASGALGAGSSGLSAPNIIGATRIAPEATNISNFAGSATPYIGAAGTALGAYSSLKSIQKGDPMGAGLGAAGAGLGLNAMGYALGPWGWGAMVALPAAAALLKRPSQTKKEDKAVAGLAKKGVTGWDQYLAKGFKPTQQKDAWFRKDLAPDFVGMDKGTGDWVNNKFAKSRNVGDLQGKDIWGYSAFGDKFGNDWFGKFTGDQREKIANAYLKNNLVTEGKGQIQLGSNPNIDAEIQKIITPPKPQPRRGK